MYGHRAYRGEQERKFPSLLKLIDKMGNTSKEHGNQ